MMRLAAVVRDGWGPLEADFQRFYGLDLRREFPRIGCRRLYALTMHLPTDAATWNSKTLSNLEELSAQLLERVDLWGRTFIQFLAGKEIGIPSPITVIRPGQEIEEPKSKIETDPRAIAAFFAHHVGSGD